MAVYRWVGQTGNSVSKYDWNTAANWRVLKLVNGALRYVTTGGKVPGPFDVATVGGSPGSAPGASAAFSPLLYGGYSGGVGGGTWLNATQPSGHTFNSALTALVVKMNQGSDGVDVRYPFPYLGGGITGEVYEWVNEIDISNPDISDSRTQSLKLKTKNVDGSIYDVDAYSSLYTSERMISLNMVKNFGQVGGGTGPTASSTAGAPTSAIIDTNLKYIGNGRLVVDGGHYVAFEANSVNINATLGASKVDLRNAVARDIITNNGLIFIDKSVTAGRVKVEGLGRWNQYCGVYIGCNIDLNSVLADSYPAGGITGDPTLGDSQLYLGSVTNSVDGTKYLPCYFGNEQKDTKAGSIDINTAFGPSGPSGDLAEQWKLFFVGGAKVNTIHSDYAVIVAGENIDTQNARVEVGSLFMNNSSVLDFSENRRFDRWSLGESGGAAGGIIFQDENSTVKGSAGVRLWNTKVLLGKVDSRLSTAKTTSKTPVADAPASI